MSAPHDPVEVRYTYVDGSIGSSWPFDDDDWRTIELIGEGSAPYFATVTLANGQQIIVRKKK